uniref:DM8 domain-containing protein n=1 Tax=Spongospora subterranea TaxID=70186 RepID=A0A0H5RAM7_9EUKA|eukprot:CRZ11220.1 hypothetical protein [Spongospora subterranea]
MWVSLTRTAESEWRLAARGRKAASRWVGIDRTRGRSEIIMERVVRRWLTTEEIRTELDAIARFLVQTGKTTLEEQIAEMVRNLDTVLGKRVRDESFQEIHHGRWDEIWPGWRSIYLISTIVLLSDQGLSSKQHLNLIDMALIFGGQLIRHQLTALAEQISSELSCEFSPTCERIPIVINCDPSPSSVPWSSPQPITRLTHCDLYTFHEKFVSLHIPVIIEGALGSWPAVHQNLFTDASFLKRKFVSLFHLSDTNHFIVRFPVDC